MRCPAAAACLALAVRPAEGVLQGEGLLTTWVSVSATPMDGACEFMRDPIGSTTDPMLAPYLRNGMHCSVGQESPAYADGAACGACYRVKSTSDSGVSGDSVVPGQASEAVVTVSTGGINGTGRFDCFPEAFEAITGATTGEFSIEFEEVECDAIQTTPSVTSFEAKNEFYCKIVFNNIGKWGTLSSVRACLGAGESNCVDMQRLSGQAWQNCPQLSGDQITFFLTQTAPSGESDTVECICPGEWPWEQGESCTCGVNFGGISLSETTTTRTTITTPSAEVTDNGGGSDDDDENGGGSNDDGSTNGTVAEDPSLSGATAVGCSAPAGAAVAVLGVLAVAQER
jgi:hypothetical protein